MAKSAATRSESRTIRCYSGADVPMSVIRRFARQVAERFQPEKIILFGSHAYGQTDEDSDVDILVIMPCRNQHDQAVRIAWSCDHPFSMDLIVRTPYRVREALAGDNYFLEEILTKGKVLYEKGNKAMGSQGRKRLSRRRSYRSTSRASA